MNRHLKNISEFFRSGLLLGFGIAVSILLSIGVYAAYSSLIASSGESLTIGKWNELLIYTVPPGAIMAFSGTTCPNNWTEYLPARGRFLRGIDSTGVNDTVRPAGNLQADELKSHIHGGGWLVTNGGVNNYGWTAGGGHKPNALGMDSAGGTETRPKNVAVLFCIKN